MLPSKSEEIASTILKDIQAKRFSEQQKLPGERQMAEIYKVSHNTVNKAIQSLRARGFLRYERGVGVFVQRHQSSFNLNQLSSFERWCKEQGKASRSKIVHLTQADSETVDFFYDEFQGLLPTDFFSNKAFVYLERDRYADEKKVIYERRLIDSHFVSLEDLKTLAKSYYEFLDMKNIPIINSQRNLRLKKLRSFEQDFLPYGQCLFQRGVNYSQKASVIDLEWLLYSPEDFEFNFELSR